MGEFQQLVIEGDMITPQEIENAILHTTYTKLGNKMVVAHITLKDGFEVIGKAGIVDPSKFDMAIGSNIARADALSRIWEHMGSILQDRMLCK